MMMRLFRSQTLLIALLTPPMKSLKQMEDTGRDRQRLTDFSCPKPHGNSVSKIRRRAYAI